MHDAACQINGVSSQHELEQEVTALYEQHAGRLLQYAENLSKNYEVSRDAVQEVYLRYFAERRYGKAMDNPRAWLYRVLHNQVLDRLKTAAVQREVSADDSEDMPGHTADPETMFRRQQAVRQLASMLSPRELDCLRLRAEGFSYDEIATVLGVRLGTVGAMLARAFVKLRTAVRDDVSLRPCTADALSCLFRGGHVYSS